MVGENQPHYDAQGNLVTPPQNPSKSQNPAPIMSGQLTNAEAAAVGATAAVGGAGVGILGSRALATMIATLVALLADPITAENADAQRAEIDKCREQLAKVQEEINAKKARLDKARSDILQEAQRLEDEGIYLSFRQNELSMIHQRRYQSRLPVRIKPQWLFQMPVDPPPQITPGAGTGTTRAGDAIPQLAQVNPPNTQ